jgi:putative transposase
MSIASTLAFSWDGKRSRLFFQTKPDSYKSESLIGFLRDLKREFRGRPCILIWDGLPAHKSREMKAYLATQRKGLMVEMLPGYSPDLNPVESLWGNLKGQELANLCADDLIMRDSVGQSRSRSKDFRRCRYEQCALATPPSRRAPGGRGQKRQAVRASQSRLRCGELERWTSGWRSPNGEMPSGTWAKEVGRE